MPDLVAVGTMEHAERILPLAPGAKGKLLITVEVPTISAVDAKKYFALRAWNLKKEGGFRDACG